MKYNNGDRRTTIHFAWWPKRLTDRTIIWLRPYFRTVEQRVYDYPKWGRSGHHLLPIMREWIIVNETVNIDKYEKI